MQVDCRYIFISINDQNNDEIWIYNFQTKSANRLTTGYSDWHPVWSLEREKLLFSRGRHFYIINRYGSDLSQVTFSDHLDEYPAWIHGF